MAGHTATLTLGAVRCGRRRATKKGRRDRASTSGASLTYVDKVSHASEAVNVVPDLCGTMVSILAVTVLSHTSPTARALGKSSSERLFQDRGRKARLVILSFRVILPALKAFLSVRPRWYQPGRRETFGFSWRQDNLSRDVSVPCPVPLFASTLHPPRRGQPGGRPG